MGHPVVDFLDEKKDVTSTETRIDVIPAAREGPFLNSIPISKGIHFILLLPPSKVEETFFVVQ